MNNHDLIQQLRHSGQFELSEVGRERLRRVLLNEFDHLASEPTPTSVWRSHRTVFATTLVAGLLVSLLGVTAIANAAKPGDALFGLDQAVEQIELQLTVSDTAKARLEARIAEERLTEQRELENRHSAHTPAAEQAATKALDQAIESVDQAQKKLEDQPSAAADRLQKTAERLKELQRQNIQRRESTTREDDDDRVNTNRDTAGNVNQVTPVVVPANRQRRDENEAVRNQNSNVNRDEREDDHEAENER